MSPPEPIPWYVVFGAHAGQGEVRLYDGPDASQAEAAQKTAERSPLYAAPRLVRSWRYPPPERHTTCQCQGSPQRQALCPFGHGTECHWPARCQEARCYHLALATGPGLLVTPGAVYNQRQRLQEASGPSVAPALLLDHPGASGMAEDEQMASWLAAAVRPTDRVFTDSPDAGTRSCLCSRCGERIRARDVPVRLWPQGAEAGLELRYHTSCLGLPGG